MNKEAILHLPDSSYAFALNEKKVVIRLRAKKGDLKSCGLYYGDRAGERPVPMKKILMEKVCSDNLFDYYECLLVSGYSRICYYFFLESKKNEFFYYYADEFHSTPECDIAEYYQFAYVRREDIACTPPWSASAVIYQIFPESFATKRRSISGKSSQVKIKTGELCNSHNGGTLRGILENLDYIAELGANCIYLNPIFTANSYHKYDTIDYFDIDPCFGSKDDLKLLVKACHENKIRVILDGVFNHCGPDFFAFKDVLANGKNSRYANWFYHLNFPIEYKTPPNYEAFGYEKAMPKLNTGEPEVVRYFCNVGTYWIKEADIDGWRLDVANEINHDFWRQFRKAVKKTKPDAFLIGEIWEDSQQWLQGDQLDSTMNYKFSNICRDFFAQRSITAQEFNGKLHAMVMRYKSPVTYAQMNLLDSHDVPRFLFKCGGDLRRLKLAVFFMMSFVGAPTIFYGDEAGISGSTEPEYRHAMPWENKPEQSELFQYYKKLITLRSRNKALVYGDFKTICADNNGVYAFSRTSGTESLLIVLNNSDTEKEIQIPLCLSGSVGPVIYSTFERKNSLPINQTLNIGAMEGRVFKIV